MSQDAIEVQGGLISRDFMERLRTGDVPGGKASDYVVAGRLEDGITGAWNQLRSAWELFKVQQAHVRKDDKEDAYRVTRDAWVRYVFDVLRYGQLSEQAPLTIEGKAYPIKFSFQGVPIEVVAYTQDLDEGPDGTARGNPHSQLQEYLNRSRGDSWGILTNGLRWRILRNNAASTRPAYIEFDLEAIMERFDEFTLWWRIAHSSRITGETPWLEKWMLEADRQGTRALEDLRKGVEQAIEILGAGFLKHPRNRELHERLESGVLPAQDYYHQVLRLVYRLIFLLVTEDRGLLLDPNASEAAKQTYLDHYGTQRLRRLAHEVRGSQHHDQFEALKVVMNGLKDPKGCPPLGIAGLNGSLWSKEFIPDLDNASIRNLHFLQAVRRLTRIKRDKEVYQTVDYQRMASEELGSIYESLLEFEASVQIQDRSFSLHPAKGNERRTTGSHYTPTELIDLVLDHALDPILDDAQKNPDAEKALLELTVCDPTCGSGHFLIAAAHRIAHRVAQARTGEFEPGLHEKRKALRDVVGRCIYGVDINPLSVELAKVGLWLEAMEPGKPLTFLDHHIKCGNALINAFPQYLEKGIPSLAYTPRDGIDKKEVCRDLVNLNKAVPMTSATLTAFKQDSKRIQKVLSETLQRIDEMPDQTVEEVLAKELEYERSYRSADEPLRYKQALDAWCAAFTYAKTSLGAEANITNGQLVDFLHSEGHNAGAVVDLVNAETTRPGNQFFHWTVEFPAVSRQGGFSVVIGNPPYVGGGKVSGRLGPHYNAYLAAVFDHYSNLGDLASAFLLRFADVTSPQGRVGLVVTNTVTKSKTRDNGLRHLLTSGWQVAAAYPNREWQGDASVNVAVVVLARASNRAILDGREVGIINSALERLPEVEPAVLAARSGQAFLGDFTMGKGFVVSKKQASEWVAASDSNAQVLLPYLTGEDLLNNPNVEASRMVICFQDWPMEKAQTYRAPFQHVEAHVKPERQNNNRPQYKTYWWRFGEYRKALHENLNGQEFQIVRAFVSDNPLFVRVPSTVLASGMTVVILPATSSQLGTLNSAIHEVWFRRLGGSMKSDVRYTPTSCYATFPLPRESPQVARLGEAFHETVLSRAKERDIALTPLWNLVNGPGCNDDDIAEIRRLRNELTIAVAEAFDMKGIDFRFGFYKDHAGRDRYTMHPEAAEQVYLALVALNAKQAAEEAAAPTMTGKYPGARNKRQKTMQAFDD